MLERMLGVGAFGVVWLARTEHPSPTGDDWVAIKVLHPEAQMNRESVERFRREAWALSQLRSAHIARMHEFLEGPPFMALVMEYVQGELLSEIVKRQRFPVEDAVHLGVNLLDGLVEMHSRGIIHRDIKPENVILRPTNDGSWQAVIFDFNLSRMRPPGSKISSLTTMHAAIGTVPYMAPEQLLDARRVAESSDVYAVGAILYRVVAGAPPFDAKQSLRDKLQVEAPPLDVAREDAFALAFAEVVAGALRRRPAERYKTATAMREALVALPRQ